MPVIQPSDVSENSGARLSTDEAPDLRERRRRETRGEIGIAALELIEQFGVAATTVEDIAKRAGVSPRTFFRYFATKEDSVLLIHENLDNALAERLQGVAPDHLLQRLERAHEEVIAAIPVGDPGLELLRRTRRLIYVEPTLRAAAFAWDCQAYEGLLKLVMSSLPEGTDPLVARIAIETSGATMRIAFDEWAASRSTGDQLDLLAIYRRARAVLRAATNNQ